MRRWLQDGSSVGVEIHANAPQKPTRSAKLPSESELVLFGAHGAIAEHDGVDVNKIEPHATTIDYVVAAAGG